MESTASSRKPCIFNAFAASWGWRIRRCLQADQTVDQQNARAVHIGRDDAGSNYSSIHAAFCSAFELRDVDRRQREGRLERHRRRRASAEVRRPAGRRGVFHGSQEPAVALPPASRTPARSDSTSRSVPVRCRSR